MKTTISLKLNELEAMIEAARSRMATDDGFSDCIEITVIDQTDVHGASDKVAVYLMSKYAECNSVLIFNNKK